MRYLSVCSGIEAATVAWHPLGWTAAGFAEIDTFPSAVLAHHYGSNMPGEPLAANGIPNFGDFTQIKADHVGAIDLLVGGTPCQDFSIAGQRAGLDGERGGLTLEFARLAARTRPRWLVWENVPGVFSNNEGADFGNVIGCFAGYDAPFAVPPGGWKNAGIVPPAGPDCYGLAWRVLDAQFAGVPQRRRRVFIVGYLGDWRPAAAVLLEPESLRGDPPPRREAGEVAPTVPSRRSAGGGLGTDFDCDGGVIASTGNTSHCLNAGGMGRQDYETETLIAHALRAEGFDASEDGTGRGTPIVPVAIQERAISENLDNGPGGKGWQEDCAFTLEARNKVQAVAFSCKDHGGDALFDTAPTLRAMGHGGSHPNSGGQVAVAFDMRGRDGGAVPEGPHDTANIRAASGGSSRSYIAHPMAVRRLTPREAERLQGFPDDYSLIPYRGKAADLCPDGPRYKALGNSMAVPVMRWIGRRVDEVNLILENAA